MSCSPSFNAKTVPTLLTSVLYSWFRLGVDKTTCFKWRYQCSHQLSTEQAIWLIFEKIICCNFTDKTETQPLSQTCSKSVLYVIFPWNKKVHNMQRNVSSSLNSAVPYILSVFRHFLSKKNTFAWYQTLSVICTKIVFKVLECNKISKKAYDCVFIKPKPVTNTQWL